MNLPALVMNLPPSLAEPPADKPPAGAPAPVDPAKRAAKAIVDRITNRVAEIKEADEREAANDRRIFAECIWRVATGREDRHDADTIATIAMDMGHDEEYIANAIRTAQESVELLKLHGEKESRLAAIAPVRAERKRIEKECKQRAHDAYMAMRRAETAYRQAGEAQHKLLHLRRRFPDLFGESELEPLIPTEAEPAASS